MSLESKFDVIITCKKCGSRDVEIYGGVCGEDDVSFYAIYCNKCKTEFDSHVEAERDESDDEI